jgi:hypothetical protein
MREWHGTELAKSRLDQAPQQRVRLLDMVAQSHIWNGQLEEAADVLSGFGPLEGREPTLGEALYAQRAGDLEVATQWYERGIEIADRGGDRW